MNTNEPDFGKEQSCPEKAGGHIQWSCGQGFLAGSGA